MPKLPRPVAGNVLPVNCDRAELSRNPFPDREGHPEPEQAKARYQFCCVLGRAKVQSATATSCIRRWEEGNAGSV
jgi:hypothetical protein